ncbi:MAG: hypothetical protein ACTSYA_01800 [Candidatus Kariarchaeaceae archaeon]
MSNAIDIKKIIAEAENHSQWELFLRFHGENHDIFESAKISGHVGDIELDKNWQNHEIYCDKENCSFDDPCDLLEEILERWVFFDDNWILHPVDGVCCFRLNRIDTTYSAYGSLTLFLGVEIDASVMEVSEGTYATVEKRVLTLNEKDDPELWNQIIEYYD